MESQSCESRNVYKVFDGSKRKKSRKKEQDDAQSVASEDSISGCQINSGRITSGKASLQDLPSAQATDGPQDGVADRDRGSSPTVSKSPHEGHRASRSSRCRRHPTRDGMSLALNAGMVSTPRSDSPLRERDGVAEPQDQDSFIYTFLEEAIKNDKKKYRHSRRRSERCNSPDRDASETREHRHRHRRHHDVSARAEEKHVKGDSQPPAINQAALLDTFAKICAQINEKNVNVTRTQSHKSLQCEAPPRRDVYEEQHQLRRRSHERSREFDNPSRFRSNENLQKQRSREIINRQECYDKEASKYSSYEKEAPKYASKMDVNRRRHEEDRYREYPPEAVPTRTSIIYGGRPHDYRDYDRVDRRYEEDRRRYCEQKTSRSFDINRESFVDDRCKRTVRSDTKDKRYNKYYNKPREALERNIASKDFRRSIDRCDRNSIVSREDEYRDRDKYSERERDSGLSVADETSTVSGRSNYLKAVKQEITEQREAMDKMMNLWKELMRCFKGVPQPQAKENAAKETAETMRESAAAQLRLWRECMRRYETVARDVGDTDARLMEEINKQRSEMTEMASMWQECLQRYRDMSNDFKSLKQKLATPDPSSECPTRLPPASHAPAHLPAHMPALASLPCAIGEGPLIASQYRIPPNYPQMPPLSGGGGGYPPCRGSPLRGRASAPPAWWWGDQDVSRRRSSADSRGSRDRVRDSRESRDRERDSRHRHKDAGKDESRYKGKSSKLTAARSEYKHSKR